MTVTAITSGSDVERPSGEYLAAWADRDPARIAALHTPGTRFELHRGDGPAVVGRAAGRTAFERIFARWPPFTFETHRLLLGDGHRVLGWTLVASPAGKAVRVPAQVILTPTGTRVTYVVRSGTVAGERIRGELLPGGGDWLVFGSDGIGRRDVRATLRLDDERHARSQLRFEADPAGPFAWLNAVTTMAVNELAPGHVSYRVFRVL